MKAVTVRPGAAASALLEERSERDVRDGAVLVETIAGRERLVIGHEALGRVVEAPEGGGMRPGDLVVPIVRRPDPLFSPGARGGRI